MQVEYVMLQGAYGWRLSPTVKAYKSYEKWDPPPEPEGFQVSLVHQLRSSAYSLIVHLKSSMQCLFCNFCGMKCREVFHGNYVKRANSYIDVQVEHIDASAGKAELRQLSLLR